ncbi:MAG: hypothetical protein U0670_21215 [Anaerolineae bacterium]
MPTPPAQRAVSTPQDFGIPTLVVTITLTEPPVRDIAVIAVNQLESSELRMLVGVYWVYLMQRHEDLISTLVQDPFDAEIIEQSFADQNTITVRVQSDRTAQIAALPGVLSVREGEYPSLSPTQAPPSRDTYQPGTRRPPIQPPGYNGG